jgi:Uma2 family endonuclease
MMPIVQPVSGLTKGSATVVPTLEGGDYFERDEFMRRYEARPDIKKAELINNIVFMASPAREGHSEPETLFAFAVTTYMAATPYATARSNMTVNLSAQTVVQPDWYLRIEKIAGGRAGVGNDEFLDAAPELVIEVAVSSASYDLHTKKDAYEAARTGEYLVWQALDHRLNCFVLSNGAFQKALPDADGIYRSRMFPGLWLNVAAIGNGDILGVKASLDQGLASPEHTAFVAELKRRAEKK